jgi:hypothetical protein
MRIVSDKTSEAGNVSTAPKYMPEVISNLSYDFKKSLGSCPQELQDGLPIPVIPGVLVRVVFLGTDNS